MDNTEQKANAIKANANAAFMKNDFQEAITLYTSALDTLGQTHPKSAILLSNRAFAQIRLENYGSAIIDADLAKTADPKYIKSYYRKATALFSLGKLKESITEIEIITKKLGIKNNKDVNNRLKQLKKLKKENDFLEAIYYQDELDKCDENALTVEPSYDGPVIESEGEWTHDNVVTLLEYMRGQKKLHKKYLWILLKKVRDILDKESNVVTVTINDKVKQVTVCGDIHGQYYDLLNIFKLNGYPTAEAPYVFNGDFVDRGSFSIEALIALLAFKLANPNCIYLNRGNHENADLNKLYGFEGEMKAKYCPLSFRLCVSLFQHLPLAHCINKKVLVLHGGLFQEDGVKIADIQKIQRRAPIPNKGIMCDMLWADPTDIDGRHPSKRGVSLEFGPDVAERFLNDNGLDLLVRSHQVKDEGFEFTRGGKVITVFSAPKYCDQMNNKGAYIIFKEDLKPDFKVFDAVEHPPVKAMHYANQSNFMYK